MSALNAQTSLAVAGGASAFVFATFGAHMPSIADLRVSPPDDKVIGGTIREAAWAASAGVIAVSLITRDGTVFVFGAATVVLLTWMYRHAAAYNADAGMVGAQTANDMRAAAIAATGG